MLEFSRIPLLTGSSLPYTSQTLETNSIWETLITHEDPNRGIWLTSHNYESVQRKPSISSWVAVFPENS
jgi:hypothetical protein